MKTADQIIDMYISEGYSSAYLVQDNPGTHYPEHSHTEEHSVYVLKGSMDIQVGEKKLAIVSWGRVDIPAGISHSVVVGEEGCEYVVAER